MLPSSQIRRAQHAGAPDRAIGRDTPFVRPGPGGLHANIGRVTWICHDQAAFAGQQHIWRTVLALTEIVLPDNDWSRISRR